MGSQSGQSGRSSGFGSEDEGLEGGDSGRGGSSGSGSSRGSGGDTGSRSGEGGM